MSNLLRERNWGLFSPPARPSNNEVTIYSRYLSKILPNINGSISILGCTPELRTLLNKDGYYHACVDSSTTSFLELQRLCSFIDVGTFNASNWMEYNFFNNYLVIGDGSLSMLTNTNQCLLLQRLYEQVPTGAYISFRLHLIGEPRFLDVKQLISYHREYLHERHFFSTIRTDMDMLLMDRMTGEVDFEVMNATLHRLYNDKFLTYNEFEKFNILDEFNKIKIYYTLPKTYDFILSLFSLVDYACGADYELSEQHPIVLLRKCR